MPDRTAEVVTGAETALVGAGMVSAGAIAIKGTLVAVGVTAGTVVLPGIGLLVVGIDLLEGNGLDRTDNIIDRVRGRPARRF